MIRLLWLKRRTLTLFAVFAALCTVALLPAGCSTETNPGQQCVGGLARDDGTCEPICDPTQCLPNNVCVDNHCRVLCDSHTECWAGVQECQAGVTDEGLAVNVCLTNGEQPALGADWWPLTSYGTVCTWDNDQCTSSACPDGLPCDLAACGGQPALCERDEAACGDHGEQCNIGRCSNWDKDNDTCNGGVCGVSGKPCSGNIDCQRCTVTTCLDPGDPASADLCTPLTCLGGAGDGDATAYCTNHDCTDDSDCPGGYFCGVTNDPRDICGPTCSGGSCSNNANQGCSDDSDCQTGNDRFCGETFDDCLDPSLFEANGGTYFEGPMCLHRKSCVKKEECAPCEGNMDCRLGRADTCVAWGSALVCSRFCEVPADCSNDMDCLYYGKTCLASPALDCFADTDCPKAGDVCVDRGVCVPRSGECRPAADAPSPFCQHCLDDADCGGPDTGSAWDCAELSYGEFACLDRSFSTSCTADEDCPLSPSGKHGECMDEDNGYQSGDSVYQRCFVPYDDFKQDYSCW
ncbi:MAG: hypothetical protein JRI68_22025 [Deltaproteobacteria bacterium]|nr:hypothetical protein [Deltaproteobacteria bacterium]